MGLGWLFCLGVNNKKEEREKSFLRNGGILLENLIASSNGKCNPIRNFSAEELITAINDFDSSRIMQQSKLLPYWGFGTVDYDMYKSYLDDRPIIVKKFRSLLSEEDKARSLAIRDMVIATQMSNHKNVLKLLGCCLEFPIPALVHEYAANGALNDEGRFGADKEFLPWNIRLRIAKRLANARTYLHTALLRPVIQRNIRPSSIFLEQDFVPKLCDFSMSITIPPEQSHARDDMNIMSEYCDPEYLKSGYVTEKSDVYSFGVLLLVFLTGKSALTFFGNYDHVGENILNEQVTEFVDPNILSEKGGDRQAQQVKALFALGLACVRKKSEGRPDMIDVAKELMRIETFP